jgi:hypothetical protein
MYSPQARQHKREEKTGQRDFTCTLCQQHMPYAYRSRHMLGRLHIRRLHQWETIGIACHVCRRGEGYPLPILEDIAEYHSLSYQHFELKRLNTLGPHRLRSHTAYCKCCHLFMGAGQWNDHCELASHISNDEATNY